MRLLTRLLLLAAALAVAGFVLVAVGQSAGNADASTPSGWYANPPGESDPAGEGNDHAYSSTLTTTYDDDSDVNTLTVVGFGLVGISFLLTAGLIVYGAVKRPTP